MTLIAAILAALAISAGGVTSQPFIHSMERAGTPTVNHRFIGMRWPCAAGGGYLCHSDETFAGLRLHEGIRRAPELPVEAMHKMPLVRA